MTKIEKIAFATQGFILLFGATAIWLSQSPDVRMASFACIFGLLSQPFFMYATILAKQWGMLILTFIYTVAWMRGVNTYWLGWF